MMMEQAVFFETAAFKIQMPGISPKRKNTKGFPFS
jgi:hypothetical protein